jgi:hypothetical protein
MNKDATVDGMYLRIIVHDNEHMGQLIAYARMNGIVPPWSKGGPEYGGKRTSSTARAALSKMERISSQRVRRV